MLPAYILLQTTCNRHLGAHCVDSNCMLVTNCCYTYVCKWFSSVYFLRVKKLSVWCVSRRLNRIIPWLTVSDVASMMENMEPGLALGMFEVFGRRGQQTLGSRKFGPLNLCITCRFERLWYLDYGVSGVSYKEIPDPDPLFLRGSLHGGEGKGRKRKGGKGKGGEGQLGTGIGRREKLEQGRRLAKAGPAWMEQPFPRLPKVSFSYCANTEFLW